MGMDKMCLKLVFILHSIIHESCMLFTSIWTNLNQVLIECDLQSQSLEEKYGGVTLKSNSKVLWKLDAISSYNIFLP